MRIANFRAFLSDAKLKKIKFYSRHEPFSKISFNSITTTRTPREMNLLATNSWPSETSETLAFSLYLHVNSPLAGDQSKTDRCTCSNDPRPFTLSSAQLLRGLSQLESLMALYGRQCNVTLTYKTSNRRILSCMTKRNQYEWYLCNFSWCPLSHGSSRKSSPSTCHSYSPQV